jgi:hypothetical protein
MVRDVPDGPQCQTRPNRPGFVLRHRGYVPVVERDTDGARWEFRAWGVPDRTLLALQERARVTGTEAVRDHYLLGTAGGGDTEELLDWLRSSIEGLAAVSADKFRTHYELAGVMAEHCEVSFDGGPVQENIAIESADLRRLASVRSQLGLHDEENLAMHEAAGMLGVRT